MNELKRHIERGKETDTLCPRCSVSMRETERDEANNMQVLRCPNCLWWVLKGIGVTYGKEQYDAALQEIKDMELGPTL
jgi:NAD-dependent SIR2 family protein deacetylase